MKFARRESRRQVAGSNLPKTVVSAVFKPIPAL